ncbi:MAG: hypothetical protein IKI57_01075 [Clostridia bacterium]|nr:hypothetical protein [Clostridia bacterium]
MVIGIVLFCFFVIILLIYFLIFKEYSTMLRSYEMLVKVLETRNLILMRILPEIKDKKAKKEITSYVEQMINYKRTNNDKVLELDVSINKKLDKIYSELNKSKNPVVLEELKRVINFEKKLKIIRREYNKAVDEYNSKLIKHPKLMAKYLKMRPYNTYDIKENVQN